MGAGKTAQLLIVRHNYSESGMITKLLKPSVDTRSDKVETRIGLYADPDMIVAPGDNLINAYAHGNLDCDCILVDEAQFLDKDQISQLCMIADRGTPVICYGLRSDFRGELFPASAALMALADDIEEIKTVCWCGKKATMNARIKDGHVLMEGPQVEMEGLTTYKALCRKHWMEDLPFGR
jgi:thymidine kinase